VDDTIRFLTKSSVIWMHDYLIRLYGGRPGLRDASMLDSALGQPMMQWHLLRSSICELAATYGYHLSENQPFVDGNKRTARMAMFVFLEYNGLRPTVSEDVTFNMILDVANRRMDKEQLASWLQAVTRLK
jgi:death on curing protein